MRSLFRLTALCVGLLLLAAPAAWACGEPGETMAGCPMADEMVGSQSSCHGGGQMAKDCCDIGSDAEPKQARMLQSFKLPTELEPSGFDVATAAVVPSSGPVLSTPVDGCGLHDQGRFTLYSSFLL